MSDLLNCVHGWTPPPSSTRRGFGPRSCSPALHFPASLSRVSQRAPPCLKAAVRRCRTVDRTFPYCRGPMTAEHTARRRPRRPEARDSRFEMTDGFLAPFQSVMQIQAGETQRFAHAGSNTTGRIYGCDAMAFLSGLLLFVYYYDYHSTILCWRALSIKCIACWLASNLGYSFSRWHQSALEWFKYAEADRKFYLHWRCRSLGKTWLIIHSFASIYALKWFRLHALLEGRRELDF